MKLANYRCPKCGTDTEELLDDTEELPETTPCQKCGEAASLFNFKSNSQRWRFAD